ncbi:MAG: LysR family transcriptional regulator, partial [Ralstonia sp.]|nr:LysR family transcriptional regulator [Ralstonia sp.]
MDKLKQIEAFIAVVEHGSMAAAALTQDVTPVMIGRRINALEARLGVKLLHRSTRRIAVTEQGAVFMEQCKKALGELDRAELLVAEGRHKATGHLIVSAPAAFGRKHVAPHAPDFLRANPDVRISFNLTDRVVDLVREGYDVGIRIGGAIDPNFVAIRLASNKRVVCGTPAYF